MLQLQITQHTHSTILFIDVRILILFFFYFKMKWEKRTENSCFCSTLTRAFGRGEWALFSCHLIFNNIETNKNTTFLFIQLRHRSIRFIFTRLNWKKGMCFDISLSFLPIHYFFLSSFYVMYNGKIDCSEIDDNIKSAIGGSQPKLARRNATNGKNHNHNHSNKNPHRAKKTHTKPREQLDDVKFIWNEALLNEVMINDVAWFCWCALFSKLFK